MRLASVWRIDANHALRAGPSPFARNSGGDRLAAKPPTSAQLVELGAGSFPSPILRRPVGRGRRAGAYALPQAAAQELVYGSWVPASDFLNSNALPIGFKQIEAETKGAIKWKVIPGGQIADGKATFSAVKDGLMQAGLGIPTYVPNLLPSNAMLYSTVIPGDDVVAATGAGSETLLLNCPSCLEEYKKLNAIPLSPYPGAASVFMCIKPVKTVEDLKGKRIRALGAAVELVKLAGATPVGATLTETVSLLQRGGIDCTYGCRSGSRPTASATLPSMSWTTRLACSRRSSPS